jgi:hypothetical protein
MKTTILLWLLVLALAATMIWFAEVPKKPGSAPAPAREIPASQRDQPFRYQRK